MFKEASKIKLRFNYNGSICVEDLWDLDLENLDVIYGQLKKAQEAQEKHSLLELRTTADRRLNLSIEIVKNIVQDKLEELKARENRAAARLEAQKIAAIIERKKDASLEDLSIEQLTSALQKLEGSK